MSLIHQLLATQHFWTKTFSSSASIQDHYFIW